MFEGLSDKLSNILNGLTRRGALTEEDVNAALREVRRALLEADVALEVVRSFTDKVRSRAVGAEVLVLEVVGLAGDAPDQAGDASGVVACVAE